MALKATITDPALLETVQANLKTLGIAGSQLKDFDELASSDLGMVSYAYPTVNLWFKIAPEGTALHSDAMREAANTDDAWKSTLIAGKAVALSAYDMLTNPAKLKAVQDGFEEAKARGGQIGSAVSIPPASCEFSRLTIPGDTRYAGVAARYAAEVARLIGFDDRVQDQIAQGLRLVLPALMQYSFEPEERAAVDVSCERIPAGLKIVLRDRGLPFGPESGPEDVGVPDSRIPRLRDHFDEISFNNLGPEGKEVILIKHLRDASLSDYEAACRLQPPDPTEASRPLSQAAAGCTVRPMEPSEALEVAKTVYRTYGYSYAHDYIYYPEKIVALNASGEVQSAVAVTEADEIAGHCALSRWHDNPRIAELGQGVVVPKLPLPGMFCQTDRIPDQHGAITGAIGSFRSSRDRASVLTKNRAAAGPARLRALSMPGPPHGGLQGA